MCKPIFANRQSVPFEESLYLRRFPARIYNDSRTILPYNYGIGLPRKYRERGLHRDTFDLHFAFLIILSAAAT